MEVAKRIGEVPVSRAVPVLRYRHKLLVGEGPQKRLRIGSLTDDTLPEVVRLALGSLVTGELPIDLILNIGHRDEGGYNTTPATGLHCCLGQLRRPS